MSSLTGSNTVRSVTVVSRLKSLLYGLLHFSKPSDVWIKPRNDSFIDSKFIAEGNRVVVLKERETIKKPCSYIKYMYELVVLGI